MTTAATGSGGDGFGWTTWWGLSPALDLQMQGHSSSMEGRRADGPGGLPQLHVLVAGASDGRHLLKTVAQAHRWPRARIHFYVLESFLELYGRQLLLLTLALEAPHRMGLQEKSELFVELFGNSLLRPHTATYLRQQAQLLVEVVTDQELAARRLPWLDLSALKFKERDRLEGIFTFWRRGEASAFRPERLWDARCRRYLGARYDARHGAYDWDLAMKLHERGAGVISSREYLRWRERGVAFEAREGVYDVANRTLASDLVVSQRGEKVVARGYWGDIVTGPFVAFGVDTEERRLLQTANGIHTHTSQDLSLHNLTAAFHELATGRRYTTTHEAAAAAPTEVKEEQVEEVEEVEEEVEEVEEEVEEGDGDGGKKTEEAKEDEVAEVSTEEVVDEGVDDSKETNEVEKKGVDNAKDDEVVDEVVVGGTPEDGSRQDPDCDYISIGDVRVSLLPLNALQTLHQKAKFRKLFNVIYFANSMVHQLTPALEEVAADKATLIVETVKFVLDLNAKAAAGYVERVTELAGAAGFAPLGTCDGTKDATARFLLQPQQQQQQQAQEQPQQQQEQQQQEHQEQQEQQQQEQQQPQQQQDEQQPQQQQAQQQEQQKQEQHEQQKHQQQDQQQVQQSQEQQKQKKSEQ
ncbi:unnamed protein product [Lampetra fluviatilis]